MNKTCTGCKMEFTLEDILQKAEIIPQGMQIEDDDMNWNMFYFNHECAGCGSTFLIPVSEFLALIDEPIPSTLRAGTDLCEQHCTSLKDLSACSQDCRYAPFRRFLIKMLNEKAPKADSPAQAR